MGVPRHLVPSAPAVEEVPSLRQRMHGIIGKASLQVQGVARFPEAEAAGQEPGHFDRLLDIEAMIDHRRIELQLDVRLSVRPHAAEHAPQPAVALGD